MSVTAIINCDCRHAFQDARYGPGKRVHNKMKDKTPPQYRCTVCKREKTK